MSRPDWVNEGGFQKLWDKPWTRRARRSRKFRRALRKHGRLTPNFTIDEFKCNDGTGIPHQKAPDGTNVFENARRHAWNLERFRHAIGDKPLSSNSRYRTPSYNRQIGGATDSRHQYGDATDFTSETIDRIGRSLFFRAAEVVFANGGVGTYPGGSGHLDSRGYKARWTSF